MKLEKISESPLRAPTWPEKNPPKPEKNFISEINFSTSEVENLEFEAKNGAVLVLSASGRTLSSSIERVYEGVNDIKFRGMFYRKDIGNCITATV